MQFSQNGWQASANRGAIGIKNYIIPGTKRNMTCAKAVAPIFMAFLAEFHRTIEKIDVGVYDDWGYASPVVIPGSNVISNHASGTAIDINSSKHPWHRRTYKPFKKRKIRLLAKKYALRWGGDYKNSVDEMHFEIVETPEQVKARITEMKLPIPKEKK
jgi:hypothetical protein